MAQLGAPGSGVPADAGSAAPPSAMAPLITPVVITMARSVRCAAGTARFDVFIISSRDRTRAAPPPTAYVERNCTGRGRLVVRDDGGTTTQGTP
jgi:hypothetical protein